MSEQSFVNSLREAAPYVHAHRGRCFVVCVPGEAVREAHFRELIFDLALLKSLGIRIVLVHGARPQIEEILQEQRGPSQYHLGRRITTNESMRSIKASVGALRMDIEALFSSGLASTPIGSQSIGSQNVQIAGGNWLVARPIGIHDGVDHGYTGQVRNVDVAGINDALNSNRIALISPVGYSPSGESFNLLAEEVAVNVAASLQADKLVLLHGDEIRPTAGQIAWQEIAEHQPAVSGLLKSAADACQSGVKRVHLLNYLNDGTLLSELFSRNGSGLLVTADTYDDVHAASIEDIGGILRLIEPLEQEGILVARSREQLELEIEHFLVMTRDELCIGCAAILPSTSSPVAELACLAVHPDYRGDGRARVLLELAELRALEMGVSQLFTLTTQTSHWFVEHGFEPVSIEDLPVERQNTYNLQRNSQVLIKNIVKRDT